MQCVQTKLNYGEAGYPVVGISSSSTWKNYMNIVVVGTGYVGLVSGACFAEIGANVTCLDTDTLKIEALESGKVPIFEPHLERVVAQNVSADRLRFESTFGSFVREADLIFIAVGTPTDKRNGGINISYVENAVGFLAPLLDGYTVVVNKSTVPVGTAGRLSTLISELNKNADFDVASNPEFLREGSAIDDFMNPDRIIVGTNSPRAEKVLRQLYQPLVDKNVPIVVMDTKSAELTKYASNAFLATKVAFINEMAALCDSAGADVKSVAAGMGLDKRIGPQFLKPGPGVGGSCFPKDTRALVNIAHEHEVEARIVTAVIDANQHQMERMVSKIKVAGGGRLANQNIGVMGLTFKPNTDDMRESPAISILSNLVEAGARLRAHDPEGMTQAKLLLPDSIKYCDEMYDVCAQADILVLMTEWDVYESLNLRLVKSLMRGDAIVDLRNIFQRSYIEDNGFRYYGVGC